ncbi:MAG TPA: hypothetical protein PK280_08365 [Planctomycetota bacterium]|nr:hypothetical protein [Planctomycetota bacterium]
MDVGVHGPPGPYGGQVALDDFFFLGQLLELVDGQRDIEALVDGGFPVPALVGQFRKPASKLPGAVSTAWRVLGDQCLDLFADVADTAHGLKTVSERIQNRSFNDLLGHQIPLAGRMALGDESAAGVVEIGSAALLLAAQLLDAVEAMTASALDEAREVVGGLDRVPAFEGRVSPHALLLRLIKQLLRDQPLEAVLLVGHYPVFLGVHPKRPAIRGFVRSRRALLDGVILREAPNVPDVSTIVDRIDQDASDGPDRP